MVEESKTAAQVVAELEGMLKVYRFDFYDLVMQPKPLEEPASTILADRCPPGWRDTYNAKKYGLIDPIIRYLGLTQRSFRWRDTAVAFRNDPHRKRMERMMIDARAFGLADGYTFPVHGRTGLLGSLSVGGRVHDLSPVEMAMFEAAGKALFWRLLELNGGAERLERIAATDMQMTRREMEVLNLLAEGMTSNEISRILRISNHTVDWYMNGIQEKLKAKNRQHVVAIALRLGLIS